MASVLVRQENKQTQLALRMQPKAFLQEYSPAKCMVKYIEVTNAEKALMADSPSLAQINRVYGHKYLIGLLSLNIINLCEYLGKKYAMTEQQINETAELLYIDNYYITLADLTLVLTQIKQGKRGGNFYENINGRKIIEIFNNYASERIETACNLNSNKEDVIKKHGYDRTGEIQSEYDVYMGYVKQLDQRQAEAQEKEEAHASRLRRMQEKVDAYTKKQS